ncbi:hypothetical protein RSOLAG22IIIB_05655 [Rhizoctonia solani]|uniref:Reverse transcriptase domain-containing protein n=1 Tax=Rhizoctonia solani TaxID=456999 RepID=A0A0K6G7S9_9AGAM|nr:hypothetical protein RSOLAG22IIIB_05655 [Rhizoctonia solani]
MGNLPTANNGVAAGYIEDVAFLAEAATFEEANETLRDMMERRGALVRAKAHTSEFALDKTALVAFRGRSLQTPVEVEIGGTVVKLVASHKLLGVIFDEKLIWREQRQAVLKKATLWAQLIQRVKHAADLWWEPTVKVVGKKKKGAVGFTKRLQSIQCTVALAITGALRTSLTDGLLSHAGIYPIELELRKVAHRAAVRLAGVQTPFTGKYNARRGAFGSRGRHPITFRTLFISSNTNDCATAPDTNDFSAAAKLLNPRILADKDAAIEEERQNAAEVKVYTDGSMHGGKVGAAAVLK